MIHKVLKHKLGIIFLLISVGVVLGVFWGFSLREESNGINNEFFF